MVDPIQYHLEESLNNSLIKFRADTKLKAKEGLFNNLDDIAMIPPVIWRSEKRRI